MAAAARGQRRYAESDDEHTAGMDKNTQSHTRFLTMGGLWTREYTRCLAASCECPMNGEFHVIDLEIPQELAGQRLDSALARLLPQHSRTRIKNWIDAGRVQVGRLPCKPRDVVSAGSHVHVRMSVEAPPAGVLPEAIALTVVHEDPDV